jgi:glycosyltransferase involved in cell wall biosynthesis
MKSYKIIVVMPAYNEEKRIAYNIKKVKKYSKNVIVVDDGSIDKTKEKAEKAGASVISYKKNKGKGYAQRLGCKEALKREADIIIIIDANQHRPEEIPKFLKALENADMIIGSRKLGVLKTTKVNKFGNWGLTFGVNLLSFGFNFKKWLTDTESGFRAFRANKYKLLNLKGNRYEIESEMVLEAVRKKLRIKEISITTTKKVSGGGLGVGVIGGFKNAWYVFKRWLLG